MVINYPLRKHYKARFPQLNEPRINEMYQLIPLRPTFDQLTHTQRGAVYSTALQLDVLTSINSMKASAGFSKPIKIFAENKAFP